MNRKPDGSAAVKRSLLISFGVIASLALLSGCTMVRNKFGPDSNAYKRSVQAPALEIPSDLDRPNQSGSLEVPERDTLNTTSVAASTAAPQVTPPEAILAADIASLSGDGLHVADTVAGTWTRVGLALERSGIASIQSRDEAGHSYQILAKSESSQPAGWLKRAVTFGKAADKKIATSVVLRVSVVADGEGSKVGIAGTSSASATTAANQVLETLRESLL